MDEEDLFDGYRDCRHRTDPRTERGRRRRRRPYIVVTEPRRVAAHDEHLSLREEGRHDGYDVARLHVREERARVNVEGRESRVEGGDGFGRSTLDARRSTVLRLPVCIRGYGWPDKISGAKRDQLDQTTLIELYAYKNIDLSTPLLAEDFTKAKLQ